MKLKSLKKRAGQEKLQILESFLEFGRAEKFSKSYGLQIPDAIIAATAMTSKIRLFAFNLKDFDLCG